MFYSSGRFSMEERISNKLQWFGLCINSVRHNPVHLRICECTWVHVLVNRTMNTCWDWRVSVLRECKRQILSAPDQSKVLIGLAELPRASAYIKINRQSFELHLTATAAKNGQNRQKAKETRNDTESETEMAAVTLTVTEAVTNKIWVQKKKKEKELSHKSFSFPPLQELINHPFTVVWSS